MILTGAPPSATAGLLCDPLEHTVAGTDGDDVLIWTDGTDVIAGLGGNDVIDGGIGNDVACGWDGDDQFLEGRCTITRGLGDL